MPSDDDYRRLLEFRTRLRRFDAWSRAQAKAAGLTHTQHQLLLAIRGTDHPEGPTIRDVADALLIKHHTAGELADRTHALGLTVRVTDTADHRRVRLRLTEHGHQVLTTLTSLHIDEVKELRTWFPFDPNV